MCTLKHEQTGKDHVVVVAFRKMKPAPPSDPDAQPPSMSVRNHALLSRHGTFLITPYNTQLETVGRWLTNATVLGESRGVVEVTWEYLYSLASRAGPNVEPFFV